MTADFLIGAVRASELHPNVKTELEEILKAEPVKPLPVKPLPVKPLRRMQTIPVRVEFRYDCICGAPMMQGQPFCLGCGRPVKWNEG